MKSINFNLHQKYWSFLLEYNAIKERIKFLNLSLLSILFVCGLTNCKDDEVAIGNFELKPNTLNIEVGDSIQVVPTLKDLAGYSLDLKSIKWTSSNEAVAIVNTYGLVIGISSGGPVTITATVDNLTRIVTVIVSPIAVSSVEVLQIGTEIVAGDSIQLTAIIKNKKGVILTNRNITWVTSNSSVASISSTGLVKGIYPGPIVTITANCEGINGVSYILVRWPPRGLKDMLWFLPYYISYSIDYNLSLLANNPHIAAQIETKVNILKSPTLAEEIRDGHFYFGDTTTLLNNRQIPIGTIFLEENMMADALESINLTKLALPMLETFMQTPYPFNGFEIWYGFCMGNTNGGDVINMEDNATYEARTGPDRMPYNAILFHEISHSYIGNEGLTQFLDIYLYNMIYAKSTDINSWVYLQGYTPFLDSNTWLHALLDIYQYIGPNNMSKAYQILYTLHPAYGSPLSEECLQVFVDQAPIDVKTLVATKVKSIDPKPKSDNLQLIK
jgi:hypothetical protein